MLAQIRSALKLTPAEPTEKLALFALGVISAAYAFLLNLLPYLGSVISREQKWGIYITAWITLPLFAFLFTQAMRSLRARFFSANPLFYPFLAAAAALAAAVTTWGLRLLLLTPPAAAWVFPAAALAAGGFALLTGSRLSPTAAARLSAGLTLSIPWLVGVAAMAFTSIQFSALSLVVILMPALLTPLVSKWIGLRLSPRAERVIDMLVILAVLLLIFDPAFRYDQHHYNFYLGPVNDLLHGRSLLVDVNSQYGILINSFLSLIFSTGIFPTTYQGLSLLLTLAIITQYLLVYALLRGALKSQFLAVLALICIIAVNFFAQMGFETQTPSTGPFRFGLILPLLLLTRYRVDHPGAARYIQPIEYLLAGFSLFWSLETGAYILTAYAGILVYESLLQSTSFGQFAARLARKALALLAALLLVGALLMVFTRLRAGEWPHWRYYLDYVLLYGTGEFMAHPLAPWTPWLLMLTMYLVSLFAVAHQIIHAPADAPRSSQQVILGLTLFGIIQFTYFIGRSHPNNLFHVAIPSIFLFFYWAEQFFRSGVGRGLRLSGVALTCCLVFILFLTSAKGFSEKITYTGLYAVPRTIKALALGRTPLLIEQFKAYSAPAPTDDRVSEAIDLIHKYASGQPRVALFLDPEITTETLLFTRLANIYPISNPNQDGSLGSARERILAAPTPLKTGDWLFVQTDTSQFHPLQEQLVNRLCFQYEFDVREVSEHGVAAVRLSELPAGQAACSWRQRQ